MKAIISHDVDTLKVSEHFNDLMIPKHIVRAVIELTSGAISLSEFIARHQDLLRNKWEALDELMAYNKIHHVPATFFLGVANGCQLNYPLKSAIYWIKRIQENGFEVGVHGIEYQDFVKMQQEYAVFQRASEQDAFGVRMHYLRSNQQTLQHLAKVGYLYDSSVCQMTDPYRIGAMWEFPLHVMDCRLFHAGKSWQTKSFKQVKEDFICVLQQALDANLSYFSILFHDRYFTQGYAQWMEWYQWVVDYLVENGISCVSYRAALEQLEARERKNNGNEP